MPTFFLIRELDYQYSWMDFELNNDLAYDYAVDIHSIPQEYLEEIEISPRLQKIEITIREDKSIVQEDWYQCLLKYTVS